MIRLRPNAVNVLVLAGALGLTACSGSSSDGGGNFVSSKLYLSNNGTTNRGDLDTVDAAGLRPERRFVSGGNEGLDIDPLGNAFHGESSSGLASIFVINRAVARDTNTAFEAGRDGRIFTNALDLPKRNIVVPERGALIVANYRGPAPGNAGNIVVVGTEARGSPASPVTPIASLPDLPASPWDLVYDPLTDRLFVALVDGTIAVYDTFFTTGVLGTKVPDRFITVTDNALTKVTFQCNGLAYRADSDALIITDIGTEQSSTDGALFVILQASIASGDTPAAVGIFGSNTLLGDPTDVELDGVNVFITERRNNLLLNMGDLFGLQSGNVVPAGAGPENGPECIVVRPPEEPRFRDVTDIDDGSVPLFRLVTTLNPDGTAGAEEGRIDALQPDLSALVESFTTTSRSLENIVFNNNGVAFATFGNDSSSNPGDGGILVLSLPFRDLRLRSTLSFDATVDREAARSVSAGLRDPKGLDLSDDRGLLFVCENDASNGDPAIVVFGQSVNADVPPLFVTTDLGSPGRRPWDCDYDGEDDRLYVACTDGTILVYDDYVDSTPQGSRGPSRVITPAINMLPVGANFHGIVHDRSRDLLIVSDVQNVGVATDGELLLIPGAAAADGLTEIQARLRGNSSELGDPVDLAWDGQTLYVADKARDRILGFQNFLGLQGTQDITPIIAIDRTKPESVALMPPNLPLTR